MGSSNGFRRKTRKLLKKAFKTRGMPSFTAISQCFHRGDYVDCFINPSVHKGMPHKRFHGKTGRVLDVNIRSYICVFYIRKGGEYREQIVTIRNEHLRKSRCDESYRKRFEQNYLLKMECEREGKEFVPISTAVEGPRQEFIINLENNEPIELKNRPYSKVQ